MSASNETGIVLSRSYNAPRELVFKAWTEAEHVKNWWGPQSFTVNVYKPDIRTGGTLHYSMHSPNGHVMWGKFVYQEIIPPERLVFIDTAADEQGNAIRIPMTPPWPQELLNTITFYEQEGVTTFTLRVVPVNATEEEMNTFRSMKHRAEQGFAGAFDKLSEYLSKI